jgi:hypothetical protein
MKNQNWAVAASIIIIVALMGSVIYFSSQLKPSPATESQLNLNNLVASTDGKVTFNVTLNKGESTTLKHVTVNGTQYLWSDGSQQDPTITKGETKQWTINMDSLKNGTNLQVTVKTAASSTTDNTTVKPISSNQTDHPNQTSSDYLYDYSGGVGLFDEGVHVIVTDKDPCMLMDEYQNVNDYWAMLKAHEATSATDQNFVSVILSRGDLPTGGYTITVQTFAWLESNPVKFQFQVNVTDPGEDILVTEAITNPLVLIPIGKLTPGEYNIEVYVTWFIQTYDKEANIVYTPVMTFAPIIWKQTLAVHSMDEPFPSTTFKVTLNGADAPELTAQIDINDGLTKDEATSIAETAFIQTMGETIMHHLDILTFDDQQISAHYTWGYDENDMGHIFDLNADLQFLQITITHCR